MKEEENTTEEPLNNKENIEVLEYDSNEKKQKDEDVNQLIKDDNNEAPRESFEIEYPKNKKDDKQPSLSFNCFTNFFFHWAFEILNLSKKYKLKVSDLKTPYTTKSAKLFAKNLDKIWDELGYKNIKKNALFRTVIKSNKCDLIIVMTISIILVCTDFFTIIITKAYIDYFSNSDNSSMPVWVLGLLLLINQICNGFLGLHSQMIQTNFGNHAGFELNCFIYNKILNYAPSGFIQRANQGEIINFIQIDSMKLISFASFVPNAFVAPLLIIGYTYLLFSFFGLSFFGGLFVLFLSLITNFMIARSFKKRTMEVMKKKDATMKIITEVFENIKILKLYNWENEFKRKIFEVRKIEMDYLDKKNDMLNLIIITNFFTPILISIVTIGLYQIFNDNFDISTMLIGLSIFEKLQRPLQYVPFVIVSIMETIVSLNRIEQFIKQPDIKRELIHQESYDANEKYAIRINNGNFSWGVKQKEKKKSSDPRQKLETSDSQKDESNKNEKKNEIDSDSDDLVKMGDPNGNTDDKINEENMGNEEGQEIIRDMCKIQIPVPKGVDYDITLKNINLEVQPGELICIVGEVGCGKSSLLQAIINSLILLNPKECDGVHINGKIGYSAQIPWILNDTIRNNILLSKPFNEEKYYKILNLCQLNEDLETFEGKDLTEIGEKGLNLSGGQKVRISIARTIYNEPDIYLFDDPISALDTNVGEKIMTDCIIRYLDGKTRIVVTHALHYLKYMDRIIYMKSGRIEWVGFYDEVKNQPFYSELMKTMKASNDSNESKDKNDNNKKQYAKNKDNNIVKLTQEEEQSRGTVKFAVYLDYFRYIGGVCYIGLVFIFAIFWQANKGGRDIWLAYWSEEENQEKCRQEAKNKWIFYSIFTALGLFAAFFTSIRHIMLTKGIIKLGRNAHRDMIEKLIKAPINLFHETVPRGQIYNRLSKDLDNVNNDVITLGTLLTSLFNVIGAFVLCGIFDPYSLIYMPIVFILGYIITSFYLIGSRPLTRMASISWSPILNVINETILGSTTIRAFNDEMFYKDKFYDKINNSFNANLTSKGITVWFQEMFTIISLLYLTYLLIKTTFSQENITSQMCAIIFTYSILLQEHLGALFNKYATFENELVSMERCCKYKHIVQEAPSYKLNIDDNLVKENWPQKGEIEFKNYSVRYRPGTEIVLKNISFVVKPGEKIGVCGRTGSGKSTICLSLFRFLDVTEGQIFIDNVDIETIGLDLLRRNLTIIPQDPCLLQGTLKYNIDPFNKTSNEEIIQILKDIGFEYTEPDDKILDKLIELSGSNLSVGQKQLVCIARALVRKNKIVIMDEATANIDMNTEKIIQKALNLVLKDSTIITVAHRIKTIVDYDKILVLDAGRVREFDTPANLLNDQNSLFYMLYNKSTL